jgi:hypothetical protein
MAAGVLLKPLMDRHISLTAFGLSQVLMDIEPLVRLFRGDSVLHGPSHTLLGAMLVSGLTIWWTPPLYRMLIRRWNREVRRHRLDRLVEPEAPTWPSIWIGAVWGAGSHLCLDALMHADMRPWAPLSDINPLLGMLPFIAIQPVCTVVLILGVACWLLRRLESPSHRREPDRDS